MSNIIDCPEKSVCSLTGMTINQYQKCKYDPVTGEKIRLCHLFSHDDIEEVGSGSHYVYQYVYTIINKNGSTSDICGRVRASIRRLLSYLEREQKYFLMVHEHLDLIY